ncbi:MAG: hypothetical protein EOP33_03065 [Rickettsiaceae bacterium]|nr:MAG: hypothetical protein EOP33_03065 [Rickettsiaceae bacterium]
MTKNKIITTIIMACIFNTYVMAEEVALPVQEIAPPTVTQTTTKTTTQTVDQNSESQKIVDEYKNYLISIRPEIRDEIILFRQEIAKLNRQKRDIYQKLSQEAQRYLEEERKFKKRLPINQKRMIGISGAGQSTELPN